MRELFRMHPILCLLPMLDMLVHSLQSCAACLGGYCNFHAAAHPTCRCKLCAACLGGLLQDVALAAKANALVNSSRAHTSKLAALLEGLHRSMQASAGQGLLVGVKSNEMSSQANEVSSQVSSQTVKSVGEVKASAKSRPLNGWKKGENPPRQSFTLHLVGA
eukprot:1107494-Pelagomonas_calceolata.AAC.2